MAVTRCVCFNKPFVVLRRVAETTGADSIEALQNEIVFGQNCRLCHPYVARMLATGETDFDVMDDAACAFWLQFSRKQK